MELKQFTKTDMEVYCDAEGPNPLICHAENFDIIVTQNAIALFGKKDYYKEFNNKKERQETIKLLKKIESDLSVTKAAFYLRMLL